MHESISFYPLFSSRWFVVGIPMWWTSAAMRRRFRRNLQFLPLCLVVSSPRGAKTLGGLRGRSPPFPLSPLVGEEKGGLLSLSP
jgi:hypothetical protein